MKKKEEGFGLKKGFNYALGYYTDRECVRVPSKRATKETINPYKFESKIILTEYTLDFGE